MAPPQRVVRLTRAQYSKSFHKPECADCYIAKAGVVPGPAQSPDIPTLGSSGWRYKSLRETKNSDTTALVAPY